MGKRLICVLVACLFLTEWNATAETPQLINYQGFLSDSEGPVTGIRSMVFSIYDVAEGGSWIWSSGSVDVEVENGVFNYMLGSHTALLPEFLSGADRWLGIQILPDEEIAPRTRLGAAPYSYQSISADTSKVGGGWTTGTGQSGPFIYPIDLDAYVGIGTVDPLAKLHVTNGIPDEALMRAGDSIFVVPTDDPVLVGRVLRVQTTDIGWIDGIYSEDIFVEDNLAGLGLYSENGTGNLGSAISLGQVIDRSFIDKWAIIRENNDGPYGGNGLRFTYGTQENQALNSTVLRMDSDGDVAIGAEDPGDHKLFVQSSGVGIGGTTAYIKNTDANGIGMIVENNSDGLAMIVSQLGEYPDGEIFRCDSWTGGWHSVFRVMNNGRIICNELELLGGADLAESFEISDNENPVPGAVMVIDDKNPGRLTLSKIPYDTRVAGIVSGAGGVNPGIKLSQVDHFGGGPNIAISGRVYCQADASNGPIKPGDLLTTSSTPGYAMKATDRNRSNGAIIGKAMTGLDDGQGLVLVLVSLQ